MTQKTPAETQARQHRQKGETTAVTIARAATFSVTKGIYGREHKFFLEARLRTNQPLLVTSRRKWKVLEFLRQQAGENIALAGTEDVWRGPHERADGNPGGGASAPPCRLQPNN